MLGIKNLFISFKSNLLIVSWLAMQYIINYVNLFKFWSILMMSIYSVLYEVVIGCSRQITKTKREDDGFTKNAKVL